MTFNKVGDISSSIWKRIKKSYWPLWYCLSKLRSSVKKAAIVVSLAVVFSIVTQRSSNWKPIKTLHLTKESFQNKNTSTQSHLGEHGPLKDTNNRASDRSRKKKSNFAVFLGIKLRKNRPISREFRDNFRDKLGQKAISKKGRILWLFSGKFC